MGKKMAVDLYRVYKQFYQRSYRYPEDQDLLEMTQLVHDLVQNLYIIKCTNAISQDEIDSAFKQSRKIFELEKSYGSFNTLFSRNLLAAFETSNFEINIPSHKIASWLEKENHLGTLYVLTARSRPNQCKLGVTQGNLEERINKYIHRHGYIVDLYFYSCDIPTPFSHEQRITKKYLRYKNSDNSDGDSNEWFFLEPDILKQEILNIQENERI